MDGSTVLFVLVGLLVLAAVAHKFARSMIHAQLEGLSSRLGLTEQTWEEKGQLSLVTGWKGDTKLTFAGRLWGPVQVRAHIPATLPLGLSLTPQGKSTHLRGMQDIQVGIPDLDAHFQVQGEHPAAVIRYLREERTQQALRGLVAADARAEVAHGEVRLTMADNADPRQIERTIQLAHRIARELAEATGAPVQPAAAPAAAPVPVPVPGDPARSPQVTSRPLRSSAPEPFVTAVSEGGLIRPRFSPAHLAVIQHAHGVRRELLRCLYAVSAGWITVLVMDRYFAASILFDFHRRHPLWTPIFLLSGLLIIGIRLFLRRCASCGSPIGEGYGVTRLVARHTITCTNCGIELQ